MINHSESSYYLPFLTKMGWNKVAHFSKTYSTKCQDHPLKDDIAATLSNLWGCNVDRN
jgi:hypothetical protein